MRRLAEVREAIHEAIHEAIQEQLEAVLEGLRTLAGIAQPSEVAAAAAPACVRCPFCQQLVTPMATVCLSCRRKLAPPTAG